MPKTNKEKAKIGVFVKTAADVAFNKALAEIIGFDEKSFLDIEETEVLTLVLNLLTAVLNF